MFNTISLSSMKLVSSIKKSLMDYLSSMQSTLTLLDQIFLIIMTSLFRYSTPSLFELQACQCFSYIKYAFIFNMKHGNVNSQRNATNLLCNKKNVWNPSFCGVFHQVRGNDNPWASHVGDTIKTIHFLTCLYFHLKPLLKNQNFCWGESTLKWSKNVVTNTIF